MLVADPETLDEADPWWEAPDPEEPPDAAMYLGPPDSSLRALAGQWVAITRTAEQFGSRPRSGPGQGFEECGLLDALEPGPDLAAFAADAFGADAFGAGLAGLNDDELAGVLGAVRRLSSWQAGLEFAAVAEIDRRCRTRARRGSSRDDDHVTSEVALGLTMTERSAEILVDLARGVARLPGVQTALLAGRIDRARAAVFVEELVLLDNVKANGIVAALVGPARQMTTARLRAAIRRLIMELFPHAVRERAARGRRQARVEVWSEGSGNAGIAGRELPAAEVIAADKRITAMAQALKNAGAAGTMDELRAAVFTALLLDRDPAAPHPAAPHPAAPHPAAPPPAAPHPVGTTTNHRSGLTGMVHLTLPLTTWLGWSESPGEVPGYGPLPAGTCRDLADMIAAGPGARWCLTLTDKDGRAAAHACARAGPSRRAPGPQLRKWLASLKLNRLESSDCLHSRQTTTYQPGRKLRHLVNVRQRTCANPVCSRPAELCDLDHTIPWDQEGSTCECNLAPVCRRHHRCKQAPKWHLDQPEPGHLTWTAPSGRSYRAVPDPYPV
jgi:hypothetical protein